MQKKRFMILAGILFLLGVGFIGEVFAQPADAQIKKDLTGAKTVSVTLGKAGTREWSSTYKKFIWTRSFTAKVKTDDPEIFVIVKGYAAYDIVGGRYAFWRSFTTSNSYEGIPDPTAADVERLLNKFGTEKFLGNYYFNRIVGKLESIGLSDAPEFEWHTPMSVSFNVTAIYTEKINDVGGRERVARSFRIRLYADQPKGEWLRIMSTPKELKKL